MKKYLIEKLKALRQLFVSNSIFCFHKYKIGVLRKFTTEKMDSYGNRSTELQHYSCERCGKIICEAV